MDQDPREPEDGAADDGPMSVPDQDLPEDLQPADDNPLAQPVDDDVPDDLLAEEAGGGGDPDAEPSDGSSGG